MGKAETKKRKLYVCVDRERHTHTIRRRLPPPLFMNFVNFDAQNFKAVPLR